MSLRMTCLYRYNAELRKPQSLKAVLVGELCDAAYDHLEAAARLTYIQRQSMRIYTAQLLSLIKRVTRDCYHQSRIVWLGEETSGLKGKKKVKVWFYIALYPVRWTAQSALHSHPLADLFIPTPFSASLGSILAMQQLRNDYSLTFPPLSIARYSFIQLSRLRRREMKENAQTSKRYQRGFEPGLSRLRVRHSTN